MPALPTYGAPRVQDSALRVPSAPPAAFGVPANVDLSGVGDVVQKHAQQAQDHADAMVVDAGELALSDLHTDLMTKATSAQGIDALQASQDAQSEFKKQSAAIVDGLPNDRVKQLVQRRAQNYWSHLYEVTESHTASETKKADAAHVTALLNNDLETARTMPSMAPGLADQAKARTEDFGRRNGWDDAQIQQESAQRVSSIHFAALGKLLQDGDPRDVSMAESYLDNYRDAFVGKQRTQAESMVDEATKQSDGFKESDKILGLNQPADAVTDPTETAIQQGVTPSGKAPLTMAQALAQAEAIQDPSARKVATQEIVAHFAHLETAARYDRESARAEVLQYVETHGGRIPYASAAWQKINGFPEGEHVEHRSDQLLKPAKDPGDAESFMTHLNMASISPASRQEFLNADFTGKDGDGMNTAQRTQLIRLQNTYRGADVRSGVAVQRTDEAHAAQAEQLRFQRETALTKAAEKYGGIGASLSKEDKAALDAEVSRIKTHFDNLQTAHGAAPVKPSDTVTLGGHIDPAHPYDPTLGTMHPAAPVQVTQQMLDGASRSPAYAEYLRNMGVVLPKKLPAPVEDKKP